MKLSQYDTAADNRDLLYRLGRFSPRRKSASCVHLFSARERAVFFPRIKGPSKLEIVQSAKQRPCMDCGGVFRPEAMDFDHRGDEPKAFNLSLSDGYPLDQVLEEIAKCDVVCSNCHRVRTVRRRSGLPATLPPPDYEI
jgi:hypothetical protein